MPDELALPRSSLDELLKMVDSYLVTSRRAKGEAVEVPAVAKQAGIDQTTLSRNNKFFASIGVIEGGRKKHLTELGEELGIAVSHGDDQLIRAALRHVVRESEPLGSIVSAVRIRGGMDQSSLQTHIAITAGATKSSATDTGAKAIIQLLLRAGSLVDEGGTFRPGALDESPPAVSEPESSGEQVTITGGGDEFVRTARTGAARVYSGSLALPLRTGPRTPTVNVTINLEVNEKNLSVARDLLRELGLLPQQDADSDAGE